MHSVGIQIFFQGGVESKILIKRKRVYAREDAINKFIFCAKFAKAILELS
jgi:hypothetical protein